MISRRKDPSAAQSDGGSESANSYGTAHAGGNNADAGAQASGSEHPINRFPGDNAEKRGSSQKPATSGSDSESDGESAGLEHWPSLPNRLSERDVPATAIKIRFNSRLRGLKRKLAGILQEFDQDRYAEVERRQAEREGSRALKECEKQQQTYPRVQPQAYLALIAPDGSVKVSMSEGLEENPKVRRAAELLTASLKHMVAGQQLDKRIAAVAAALAARAAGRSLGGANRRQPIHLSSGSDWKECKEQCRCQQRCAALRAKTGWPADLACVDPNDKGTSVDSQWSHAFLRFAKTHGWYNQAALANQPNRQPCAGGSIETMQT
ncbi:g8230 [Coccomyxa viridis]|uniref:G8230 protein n=1 Tax=Coccomyxa viridis TaxID=1274662 RepID=A0ABP1G0Z5_9CHLO